MVPFLATLAVGAGLLPGILPALYATRAAGLAGDAPNDAEPRYANRVHEGFVAAQFALLMVLLATAGLIIQSHRNNANRTDRGYRVSDVGVFRVAPGLNGYGPARSRALVEGIDLPLRWRGVVESARPHPKSGLALHCQSYCQPFSVLPAVF